MKKIIILIGTIVLSLIMTFMVSGIFSLYHFGNVPTILTIFYLLSIFSVFEYILISITYIVRKLVKKEKIEIKNIIAFILLFISLILILLFLIVIDIDWLNWYAYSSPFYINVIVRSIEFLLPAIVSIIISIFLLRKKK